MPFRLPLILILLISISACNKETSAPIPSTPISPKEILGKWNIIEGYMKKDNSITDLFEKVDGLDSCNKKSIYHYLEDGKYEFTNGCTENLKRYATWSYNTSSKTITIIDNGQSLKQIILSINNEEMKVEIPQANGSIILYTYSKIL